MLARQAQARRYSMQGGQSVDLRLGPVGEGEDPSSGLVELDGRSPDVVVLADGVHGLGDPVPAELPVNAEGVGVGVLGFQVPRRLPAGAGHDAAVQDVVGLGHGIPVEDLAGVRAVRALVEVLGEAHIEEVQVAPGGTTDQQAAVTVHVVDDTQPGRQLVVVVDLLADVVVHRLTLEPQPRGNDPLVADVDAVLDEESVQLALALEQPSGRRRVDRDGLGSCEAARVVVAEPAAAVFLLGPVPGVEAHDVALGADPELMVVAREDCCVGVDLLAGTVCEATGQAANGAAVVEEQTVEVVVAEVVAGRGVRVTAGETVLGMEAVVGANVVTVANLDFSEDLRGGGPVPQRRAQLGRFLAPVEAEEVSRSVASALAVARSAHIGRGELVVIAGLKVDLGDRRTPLVAPVEDRVRDDVRVGVRAGAPDPVVGQFGAGNEEPGTIAVDRAAESGLVVVDDLVGTVEIGVVPELADPRLVLSDVVEVAVEHIGARLDHRVDRRRLGASVLGAAALGMNLGCGNLRGRHPELEHSVVARDLADVDAVDVHRASVSGAAHEAVEPVLLLGAGIGRQHRQAVDVVTSDERRQLGGLGVDPRRRPWLVLVDHGRFRDDADLLGFVSA